MTRKTTDPGELPEVQEVLAGLAARDPAPAAPGPAPAWDFPCYTTHFWCPGPQIAVRFPDGITVEFRPGSPWFPRRAKVEGMGVTVKGHRLDIGVDVGADGRLASIPHVWKTGVAGADGAADVPAGVRDAAVALCQKRAAEARAALGIITGQRRPAAS